MSAVFVSLLCIVAVSFIAPLISWSVPKRLLPETVLLIAGGVLIGPRGPQGVVCPLLETDELGGGADAVPQTGRGEDVALVPVGLEHDELHGDLLGRGGACAVCHV